MSLANTLIEPLVSDAEALAAAGFATPEDINIAMQLWRRSPAGPLPDVQPDTQGSAEPPSQFQLGSRCIGTGTMATGIVEVFATGGSQDHRDRTDSRPIRTGAREHRPRLSAPWSWGSWTARHAR